MDPRYMVKRYLARVWPANGYVFDVFSTGSAGWLLFCPIAGTDRNGNGGYQTGLHIAVQRTNLRKEVRRVIPQG